MRKLIIERGPGKINYRTKMGNVRKMGENRIIEQQRSDKNYIERRIGVNSDTFFSHLPRKTEL